MDCVVECGLILMLCMVFLTGWCEGALYIILVYACVRFLINLFLLMHASIIVAMPSVVRT